MIFLVCCVVSFFVFVCASQITVVSLRVHPCVCVCVYVCVWGHSMTCGGVRCAWFSGYDIYSRVIWRPRGVVQDSPASLSFGDRERIKAPRRASPFTLRPAPRQGSIKGNGSELLAGPSPSITVRDTVMDTRDSQSDIATVAPLGLLAAIVSPASSLWKKRKHSPSKFC